MEDNLKPSDHFELLQCSSGKSRTTSGLNTKVSNMDDSSTASCSASPSPEQEDRDLQEAIRLSKMDGSSTASGSPSPSPDQLQEDLELQEAIRISKLDGSSTASASPSPASDRSRKSEAGMKRKAQDYLESQTSKRGPSAIPSMSISRSYFDNMVPALSEEISSNLSSPSSAVATLKYPNGALRITRTPGRRNAKNCINLKDVIQGKSLVSACAFSFFIGEEEFYSHFPLSHSSDTVPIYIGRDVNMGNYADYFLAFVYQNLYSISKDIKRHLLTSVTLDPMTPEACRQAGIPLIEQDGKPKKVIKKNMKIIEPKLREMYAKRLGKNYHAFYAWSPGSSHSKILVLVYPDFLRLVITSCNMMDIDTVLGDNHWYIHDLKKSAPGKKSPPTSFETELLSHLAALGTPEAFIESIAGVYDYSSVKVHLTTSVPGVCSGAKAESHGLLRFRRIVRKLDLHLSKKASKDLSLEICAASIGNLSVKWLNNFNDCVLGRATLVVDDASRGVPNLKLFYPTVGDVKNADSLSQDAASNIGCHTRPWTDAPNTVKRIFHHYHSKDAGKLFHQKLILAYNPQAESAAPYFVYVGSANFSQAAWGALEEDKKKNQATSNTKLVKISNFECGVVVPGNVVESLLEDGTKSWQDGIVPFEQDSAPYDLSREKPWNDPRWVANFDENYQS
ncbi:hypothetical protein VTL71DRAFT_14586 [Oculimacula yallundae]|uniref:PLD phosphodiesterase domain-containing protein n=1 Tax=Oculimacula yallundae TaxID=86028 RepID=A0ABR4CIW2_9HELO